MNKALQAITRIGEAQLSALLWNWLDEFDMEARKEFAGRTANHLTRLIDLIGQTRSDEEPTEAETQLLMDAHYELGCMRDVAQTIHKTASINARNAKGDTTHAATEPDQS